MSSTILVLNAGSSSIKYRLLDPDGSASECAGVVERIGEDGSRVRHTYGDDASERELPVPDHREGMRLVLDCFERFGPGLGATSIAAVGHRVVMGGRFAGPALITDEVVAAIDRLSPLAPLHNPPGVATIEIARALLPELAHVAVFDTSFFHDLPAAARTYALDHDVSERYAVRRYGFHGTSHQYVSRRTAEVLGRELAELRQIVLHLGNGASASAIAGGRPVDTSMGLTPLEGLVMGTRSGDLDPAVVFHLCRVGGMSIDDVDDLLNHRSGLLGLTGVKDMRDVHRLAGDGDDRARLGLDVYVHRLRKYIGGYAAIMGGVDAITFTAGVGENDAVVRARTVEGLGHLGVELDPERNAVPSCEPRVISPAGAPVSVLVVPTNEELEIARQVRSLIADDTLDR